MKRRLLPTLVSMVLIALVLTTGVARPVTALAQVEGLSYTSPTYGYSISWDNTWFVIEEQSDQGADLLTLNNGFTYVFLSGRKSFAGKVGPCALGYRAFLMQQEGLSNVQTVPEEAGARPQNGDGDRAWATYSFTFTLPSGDTIDVIEFIECRTLVPGSAVLQIQAQVRAADFAHQMPEIDKLTAQLKLPSLGEPGPVFASGPWRVAIVGAERDVTVPEVRLKENAGKEWVVVVADITNWSRDDAVLDWKEVTLVAGGKPIELADKATLSVARMLDAEPGDLNKGLMIAPGETVRAALAFRIGDDRRGPAFRVGDETLSLLSPLSTRGVNLTKLPAPVTPPALTEVSVHRVIDGARMEVVLRDGEERAIRLAGVDAPVKDDCFSAESMRRLRRLAGESVLLESTAPGNNETYYIWVDGDDGVRTLLNQAMIEGGHAGQTGGNLGRFGSWLVGSEERARVGERGLWSRCTDLHGVAINDGDDATGPGRKPSANPTAEPTKPVEVDTSYDGNWSGETAEGADLSFTIKDGGVRSFRLAYECAGASGTITTNYVKPVPVVDDGFVLDLTFPTSNDDEFMRATFGPNGDASGEITIAAEGCPGGVIATTWRATRDAA